MTKPWVDDKTIGMVLETAVERHADRDALVFPALDLRLSYRQLHKKVVDAARALQALGVSRGDHVGILATNRPEWVVLQCATAMLGAPLVTINPAYQQKELAYVLAQADITTLFCIDRFRSSDYIAMLQQICPELKSCEPLHLASAACPKLRNVVFMNRVAQGGIFGWDAFLNLAGDADADIAVASDPEDVVNIQYTSGTTGFPKAAMLSHRNLLLNAYYVGKGMRLTPEDRVCIPVPFFHCFGCVLGTLCCLVHGAAMVIPAEYFDPAATLRAVQDQNCSVLYSVPTMFIAMLQHPDFSTYRFDALRTGVMGGSPCPVEVMKRIVHTMGAKDMTITYGLTEASPIVTQTPLDGSLESRMTTVGAPLEGVEVKIIDPASGAEILPGQPGELCVRGHGVMKGYYKMPEETAKVIDPEGWLHSGDLAVRTPEGFYKIVGRSKDMIVRGGEKIYPREVEEFLHTHPDIQDVHVVGLPDSVHGEQVCAWIRTKDGTLLNEEQVRNFCRGRIAHYKIPAYVENVESFPVTLSGKVKKNVLREMGIRKRGLEEIAKLQTA